MSNPEVRLISSDQTGPDLGLSWTNGTAESIENGTPVRWPEGLPVGITLKELMQKELPEIRWVVPNVIPEGVTLLAGRAKIGKTFCAATSISYPVAAGGRAFGTIPVEKGRAIYLSLEDGERSLRRRFDACIEDGVVPDNLHLFTSWSQGERGMKDLRGLLNYYQDTRLVVVDTLRAFTGPARRNSDAYDSGYSSGSPFQALAKETNTAIILVHHTNKSEMWTDPFDQISGSMGLRGIASIRR